VNPDFIMFSLRLLSSLVKARTREKNKKRMEIIFGIQEVQSTRGDDLARYTAALSGIQGIHGMTQ
jgi:hypothetical protein